MNEDILSTGQTTFLDGDSLHRCKWNIPTCAKRMSAPGACGSSVHGEITSDSASTNLYILSPVHQDDLPHRTSLLTARPRWPETHYHVNQNKIILTWIVFPIHLYFWRCLRLVAKSCPTLWDSMDCTHKAPLSTGFPRQEYWNGLPFSSPGDLPKQGIKPGSHAWQANSFATEPPGKSTSKLL